MKLPLKQFDKHTHKPTNRRTTRQTCSKRGWGPPLTDYTCTYVANTVKLTLSLRPDLQRFLPAWLPHISPSHTSLNLTFTSLLPQFYLTKQQQNQALSSGSRPALGSKLTSNMCVSRAGSNLSESTLTSPHDSLSWRACQHVSSQSKRWISPTCPGILYTWVKWTNGKRIFTRDVYYIVRLRGYMRSQEFSCQLFCILYYYDINHNEIC